jgi:hypothetical protein
MTMAGRKRKLFELEEARSTLPLVSRIVSDIVEITATMEAVCLESREAAKLRDRDRLGELRSRLVELADAHLDLFEELASLGVEMKDAEIGLVDFPARLDGRIVYLCWKLGEETIDHWHELTTGFGGREPVEGNFDPATAASSNGA